MVWFNHCSSSHFDTTNTDQSEFKNRSELAKPSWNLLMIIERLQHGYQDLRLNLRSVHANEAWDIVFMKYLRLKKRVSSTSSQMSLESCVLCRDNPLRFWLCDNEFWDFLPRFRLVVRKSFVAECLVARIAWFRATLIIGGTWTGLRRYGRSLVAFVSGVKWRALESIVRTDKRTASSRYFWLGFPC